MGDGLLEPPTVSQSEAQIVVRLDVVGLDCQGRPVMDNRLVNPPAMARAFPRL